MNARLEVAPAQDLAGWKSYRPSRVTPLYSPFTSAWYRARAECIASTCAGVSRLRSGHRHTVGIIFHAAT